MRCLYVYVCDVWVCVIWEGVWYFWVIMCVGWVWIVGFVFKIVRIFEGRILDCLYIVSYIEICGLYVLKIICMWDVGVYFGLYEWIRLCYVVYGLWVVYGIMSCVYVVDCDVCCICIDVFSFVGGVCVGRVVWC